MVRAQASELLFSQLSDGQSTYGPSELWKPAGINSEVADDFEVIGNIDRLLTVTNISKTGYTFDAVNSVLSKSLTKCFLAASGWMRRCQKDTNHNQRKDNEQNHELNDKAH